MADGRCYTINTASQLFNDYLMTKNKIAYEDNYSYRQLLQKVGPAIFDQKPDVSGCSRCNTALLKVPNIY
jgi:hypothetical protein